MDSLATTTGTRVSNCIYYYGYVKFIMPIIGLYGIVEVFDVSIGYALCIIIIGVKID